MRPLQLLGTGALEADRHLALARHLHRPARDQDERLDDDAPWLDRAGSAWRRLRRRRRHLHGEGKLGQWSGCRPHPCRARTGRMSRWPAPGSCKGEPHAAKAAWSSRALEGHAGSFDERVEGRLRGGARQRAGHVHLGRGRVDAERRRSSRAPHPARRRALAPGRRRGRPQARSSAWNGVPQPKTPSSIGSTMHSKPVTFSLGRVGANENVGVVSFVTAAGPLVIGGLGRDVVVRTGHRDGVVRIGDHRVARVVA